MPILMPDAQTLGVTLPDHSVLPDADFQQAQVIALALDTDLFPEGKATILGHLNQRLRNWQYWVMEPGVMPHINRQQRRATTKKSKSAKSKSKSAKGRRK